MTTTDTCPECSAPLAHQEGCVRCPGCGWAACADGGQVTTRAEHHATSDEATVATAKDRIAWILQRRDCREWAISSQALADAVGTIEATTVRDCIREIRREDDLPVVSCSQGYYVIDDADALQRELDRIQDEIETREATKRELAAAFNRQRYD